MYGYFGQLTHINFMATSLKPFCSKRSMIFPTSPRWTPSGFTIMKVRSLLLAITLAKIDNTTKMLPIITWTLSKCLVCAYCKK